MKHHGSLKGISLDDVDCKLFPSGQAVQSSWVIVQL